MFPFLSGKQELADQSLFFSHTNDDVGSKTVVHSIDKNCLKLGKNDARYYMLSINPSQDEMKHIASLIVKVITNTGNQDIENQVSQEVNEICSRFPVPGTDK